VTDVSLFLLAGFASHWEVWIILLIILILFGSRLPGIARSLGQGINQFKKGLSDTVEDKPAGDAKPAAEKSKAEEPKV
jgi:sec-independent protein translocase protein TatA